MQGSNFRATTQPPFALSLSKGHHVDTRGTGFDKLSPNGVL
jgi:hypothetical protein